MAYVEKSISDILSTGFKKGDLIFVNLSNLSSVMPIYQGMYNLSSGTWNAREQRDIYIGSADWILAGIAPIDASLSAYRAFWLSFDFTVSIGSQYVTMSQIAEFGQNRGNALDCTFYDAKQLFFPNTDNFASNPTRIDGLSHNSYSVNTGNATQWNNIFKIMRLESTS